MKKGCAAVISILMSLMVVARADEKPNAATDVNGNVAEANGKIEDAAGEEFSYKPNFHGVIIPRWEGEFGHDGNGFEQRFQVRNARFTLDGNVLPSLSYFVQIDVCDMGKFKVLDVYGKWNFLRNWSVQAGQFRIPYGIDCFRGPATYFFGNRSFLAKYVLNMRNVGVQIGYSPSTIPITVNAGVFNTASMADQHMWQRSVNAAVKANYRLGPVTFSASYASIDPDCVRINLVGAGATFESGRWIVESEYQNKHYTNKAHKPTQGWNVFGRYALPLVNKGIFNRLDFLARYDGMTANSSGVRDESGELVTDESRRQRITLGAQLACLAYQKSIVNALVRVNYEHYFYPSTVVAEPGQSNKIVIELLLKF